MMKRTKTLPIEAPKASNAILFYKAAFGAEEVGRTLNPVRRTEQEIPHILSAELKILGSTIFVADYRTDENDPYSLLAQDSESVTGAKAIIKASGACLVTDDVEAAVAKAVGAGAVAGEVMKGESFCCCTVTDPYGFHWFICSPVKECGDVEALFTNDVEGVVARSVSGGATVGELMKGKSFCCYSVKDPFGFHWFICSPLKEWCDVEA